VRVCVSECVCVKGRFNSEMNAHLEFQSRCVNYLSARPPVKSQTKPKATEGSALGGECTCRLADRVSEFTQSVSYSALSSECVSSVRSDVTDRV